MPDLVQTITMFDGLKKLCVNFKNVCDGTGETNSTKVDINQITKMASARAGDPDTVPSTLVVERIEWDVQGFTDVRLFWDTDEDNYIAILGDGSHGELCWGDIGLVDPAKGQDNGNIQLTTSGNASGDTYDITLWLRKKS